MPRKRTGILPMLFAAFLAAPAAAQQDPLWELMPMDEWEQAVPGTVAHLAIETYATNANAALSANQVSVARITQAVRMLIGAGARVTVANSVVRAEYQRMYPVSPQGGLVGQQPRITGFRAATRIIVQTERPEELGRAIDAAVGAGANRLLAVPVGARGRFQAL
jgi:uncharacterized protein YggE